MTLQDLKIKLDEESLFIDYDDPDYDAREYAINYISHDENGDIVEFSGYIQTFDGEIKEQD